MKKMYVCCQIIQLPLNYTISEGLRDEELHGLKSASVSSSRVKFSHKPYAVYQQRYCSDWRFIRLINYVVIKRRQGLNIAGSVSSVGHVVLRLVLHLN